MVVIKKSDNKSKLFIKNTNTPKNVNERMNKLQILGVANNSAGKGDMCHEL